MQLYPTFFRMVGKSNEYTILYKSLARMFYLRRPSQGVARYNFVLSLNDPIRHGQQRYPHLVMQMEVKDVELTINMDEVCVCVCVYVCVCVCVCTCVCVCLSLSLSLSLCFCFVTTVLLSS